MTLRKWPSEHAQYTAASILFMSRPTNKKTNFINTGDQIHVISQQQRQSSWYPPTEHLYQSQTWPLPHTLCILLSFHLDQQNSLELWNIFDNPTPSYQKSTPNQTQIFDTTRSLRMGYLNREATIHFPHNLMQISIFRFCYGSIWFMLNNNNKLKKHFFN